MWFGYIPSSNTWLKNIINEIIWSFSFLTWTYSNELVGNVKWLDILRCCNSKYYTLTKEEEIDGWEKQINRQKDIFICIYLEREAEAVIQRQRQTEIEGLGQGQRHMQRQMYMHRLYHRWMSLWWFPIVHVSKFISQWHNRGNIIDTNFSNCHKNNAII